MCVSKWGMEEKGHRAEIVIVCVQRCEQEIVHTGYSLS